MFVAAGGHDHTGAVGHGTQLASAALGNSIVVSSRLADNAVTRRKIVNQALSSAKIGTSAVVVAKINNNAVTRAKIINQAVGSNKIGTSQVLNANIKNGAVTRLKAGLGVYRGSGTSPNKRLAFFASVAHRQLTGGFLSVGTLQHGLNTVVACGHTPLYAFGANSIVYATVVGQIARFYVSGRTPTARVAYWCMGYPIR